MNKKMLLAVAVIAITALTIFALFVYTQIASIDFWLDDTYEYKRTNAQWETVNYATNATSEGIYIPINCRNDGSATGTFALVISFNHATYSGSNAPQRPLIAWDKINETTAKYYFILKPNETQSINIYFSIDNETQNFSIMLSLESSQTFLRVESAQRGSQPWQVVYRALFYGLTDANTYLPAHIS